MNGPVKRFRVIPGNGRVHKPSCRYITDHDDYREIEHVTATEATAWIREFPGRGTCGHCKPSLLEAAS